MADWISKMEAPGRMVSTHHFMQVDGLSTQFLSSKMSFKKENKLENLDLLTSASIYSNSSGRNRHVQQKYHKSISWVDGIPSMAS